MKISYDYTELINELKSEVDDGLLHLDEEIQILRGEEIREGYRPIIDWYYSHDKMKEYLNELPQNHRNQYNKDFKQLETVAAFTCLSEMRAYNKIL